MEAAVSLSCYYPEPADPANDPNPPSFNNGLVDADTDHPTPRYASQLGYHGYLSGIKASSGAKLVAYQNLDDFWLATGATALNILDVDWVTNQIDHKPDDRSGLGQYLNGTYSGPMFQRGVGIYQFTRIVSDPHEAMSYVSRSRTRALGAEPTKGTPTPPGFQSVNLKTIYQFSTGRPDHSGQFQRNIQLMYGNETGVPWGESLYHRLMRDLNVDP